MNPYQHSAVAATISEELEMRLRINMEDLGNIACNLAEVLAKTYGLDLGEPPDSYREFSKSTSTAKAKG